MINSRDMNIITSQNNQEKEYWLKKLAGELTKTSFPADHLRVVPGGRGMETYSFELPSVLVPRVNKIANQSDVRLFVILITNLMVLLHKYTQNQDILLGIPIYKQDFEGEFINTVLVIRELVENNRIFKQLLMNVGQTIYAANENQNYPFESLLYQLDKLGDQGENLLFDTGILLTNIHQKEYLDKIHFNLLFSFTSNNQGITGTIFFNSGLYHRDSISVIANHYLHLLANALSHLDAPVSDLEILGEDEKNKLLYEFNDTGIESKLSGNLAALFEAQVKRTPENVAIIFNDCSLTYQMLNGKANQLARLLRKMGIGPESITGLLVERSLEMAIAIIAVLKSGGAYLPIDPDYPRERINFMLQDSKAEVLLTQSEFAGTVECGGEIVRIDDPKIYQGEESDLGPVSGPDNLAYVIYTSGSTGQPKGVMVEQRNVVNYLNSFLAEFEITDADTVIQVSSYAFDAFVEEFYPVLLRGGKIAIPGKNVVIDPQALAAFINRWRGTFISCSPLLLNELNGNQARTSIRTFISGGDVLKAGYIQNLLDHATVYNTYGPTESTVCVTYYKCRAGADLNHMPIGKPIGNYKVLILDGNYKICPLNIPGQLCVSGPGVARGYLHRDQLTREKFIENPYMPGERLYLTGDLARVTPDGNIEFFGRIDNQVKIRGYRIELEEIENRLLAHPLIKEALVVVREDEANDKYLCSYVISDSVIHGPELKEYLRGILPYYMIPAYIVQLDKLPVNIQGKVDQKSLPDPMFEMNEKTFIAPSGELEKKLAAIWTEVLGIDDGEISVLDNFFDLGGHSLKATRLALKIFKEFNIQMPVMEIFNYPTIQELAEYIHGSRADGYWSIEPAPVQAHYPLSSAQIRIFVVHQLRENTNTYNMTGAMLVSGPLDREKMEEAVNHLIQRHEAFRTSFVFHEDEPVQIIHDRVTFKVDYIEDSGESTLELINGFMSPLDLSKAPLLRVRLVKIEENKHLLLFDTHHIIADGISFDILIKDFMSFYRGNNLPPLKLQYKDYAVWQNKLPKDHLLQQEKYWMGLFAGPIPALDIPTDFPRASTGGLKGGRIRFQTGPELAAAVKSLASRTDTTVFMVLLAVYSVLLSKYSGQEDVIIGAPVAGRPHIDLENIIGMFVNMLPIRSYPTSELTFGEFLHQVKRNTLDAQANQDYPFEDLVDKLGITREPIRNPLFNYAFALENFEISDNFEFDGLKFTKVEFDSKVVKFDLGLWASQQDGEINFELEYMESLFKKSTVEKIGRNYLEVLLWIVRDETVNISDINLAEDEYTAVENQTDSGEFDL